MKRRSVYAQIYRLRYNLIRLRLLCWWFDFVHDLRASASDRLEEAVVEARDELDITY